MSKLQTGMILRANKSRYLYIVANVEVLSNKTMISILNLANPHIEQKTYFEEEIPLYYKEAQNVSVELQEKANNILSTFIELKAKEDLIKKLEGEKEEARSKFHSNITEHHNYVTPFHISEMKKLNLSHLPIAIVQEHDLLLANGNPTLEVIVKGQKTYFNDENYKEFNFLYGDDEAEYNKVQGYYYDVFTKSFNKYGKQPENHENELTAIKSLLEETNILKLAEAKPHLFINMINQYIESQLMLVFEVTNEDYNLQDVITELNKIELSLKNINKK